MGGEGHAMFKIKNCCCGIECPGSRCRWGPSEFRLVNGEPQWNPQDVCDAIFWAFGETDEEDEKSTADEADGQLEPNGFFMNEKEEREWTSTIGSGSKNKASHQNRGNATA